MASADLLDLLKMVRSDQEDVRFRAFLLFAQLSGSDDGSSLLSQCPNVLKELVESIANTPPQDTTPVLPTTLTTLTNIAAVNKGASALMVHLNTLLPAILKIITAADSRHADRACGLFVNIIREYEHCRKILLAMTANSDSKTSHNLISVAANTAHNTKDNNLNLLMSVIENMSQLEEGRRLLLNHESFLIQRLLPFTQYTKSEVRRRAIVSVLRNCCFEKDEHLWLLSDKVDLQSYLCLPLAGPEDITDHEDFDGLPDQLKYLPPTKTREPNPKIRLMLVQALLQLCTTRAAREQLRRQGIYLILRELHKWEQDRPCLLVLDDLINIFIRLEDEIGVDDLSSMEVTEEYKNKFEEWEREDLGTTEPAASPE